ncbi:MAG TPA: S9 family peptidase [Thermoanaerobaculia bacterium]|nr:S9 family peptidase [Thermoanaerobaculia bacterium]
MSNRLRLAASILALAAGFPARAAERRAFAIADLYRLKTVASPAVSPDGRWIAYSVKTTDLAAMTARTNLWRVDADGSNARPLTSSDAADTSPLFSPDGKSLAFLSTREGGEAQLWLLPTAGGEAAKLTSFPGGVDGPLFSPDGARLAFTSDVYPECGADAACNKRIDDAAGKTKLKAHVADGLLYRHWTSWKDGKRAHVLVMDLATKKALDVTPGDFDAPVFSTGGPLNYAFSPDGKELAFVSNHDPDPESSTNADVFVVDLGGTPESWKSPRDVTKGNPAWDGQPRYSPDGKWLAIRRQAIPRYESDPFRLALLDRKTGKESPLAVDFDDWIDDFAFSADGKRLLFQADVKGRTPLYQLDLATGKSRVVTNVGNLDSWSVAPDGTWAAVARRRVGSPSELWRIPLASAGTEIRLTRHNEDVEREVDIRPAEETSVKGADGRDVQVWIVKPHGFDPSKKYPLILNIHGGPQQQFSDAFRGDYQVYPGAGYVVAFANPHGSTGFGQEFTAAISGDWSGKVMEDIRAVTRMLTAQPYVDKDRMGAMGWSWGGYAIMWLEGHNDLGFKCLASMMGVYDLRAMYSATEELWFPAWDLKGAPWENPAYYKSASPSEYVKDFKTPCLVVTGEEDYRVPYTQSLEFFTDLKRRNVPARLVVLEKSGHWPAWYEMALYYDAHLDWFHKYLGGAPAPWDVTQMMRGLVSF